MAEYRPERPFDTPIFLFIPQYTTAKGSTKKTYPEEGELLYCSFKTYGGTEKEVNGVIVVEDTANIETWFRPDITADCQIRTAAGAKYEIISEPENINMRNQFMKFKIRRVKGGA